MDSPGDMIQHFRLLRHADGALWELTRTESDATYKTLDTTLELTVALTVVGAAQTDTEVARAEIMQRARSLMFLDDARIVQISYAGVYRERVFAVRRYIDGESIAHYVKRNGAIEWAESLRIALEVTRALQSANASGVIHGNITPATVILKGVAPDVSRRDVRLVDFALANAARSNSRSDIRALGEVLRTMLLGSLPPHETDMFTQQLHPGVEYDYPNVVPSAVVELVTQMTSPDDRVGPSNAAELLRRISNFFEVPPIPVIPQPPDPFSVAPDDLSSVEPRENTTPPADNLQFTAYRPKVIRPGVWTKMLVFAHLEDRPAWLNDEDRSPHEEVIAQAQQLLGEKFGAYRHSTDDSRLAVPRDGEITMLPEVPGIEFNPPRRSFFWRDGIAVHSESFDVRAHSSMDGQTARGRLTIFLGRIILAEISLAIRVDGQFVAPSSKAAIANDAAHHERSVSRAFRKVFASYSHRDLGVVEEMERHARSFGDEYLRDWVHLRSGERWHDGLQQLIRAADVFQLFWSPNSAQSEFVAQEWQYALALGRDTFVRPTYWQDPMPAPPDGLRALHFHRLAVAVPSVAKVEPPALSVVPDHASASPVPMPSSPMAAMPMPTSPPGTSPIPMAPPPENQPKRSGSLLILLVGIAVAILIGLAIFRSLRV